MQKSKIEWTDYTWNPIKGLCPEACWYCYARRMYQRFGWDSGISLDTKSIEYYGRVPDGSKIFVCSTIEIFNPEIPESFRKYVFKEIEKHRNLTFIILTKRPERIDRPMPDNVWLGVSVTGADDMWRIFKLAEVKAKVRFISLEPFFRPTPRFMFPADIDWLIIGRLTGHGRKDDPELAALQFMVMQARAFHVPVFLKNNLKGIWPGPLIQEYPR